jgi:hypothetical protein
MSPDIFNLAVFYFKHDLSETGFCLRLQVEPTQEDLIDIATSRLQSHKLALSSGSNWVGSTW